MSALEVQRVIPREVLDWHEAQARRALRRAGIGQRRARRMVEAGHGLPYYFDPVPENMPPEARAYLEDRGEALHAALLRRLFGDDPRPKGGRP